MKSPRLKSQLGTCFTRLEDRTVPHADGFGIPWADPGRLTLSFVPDGTPTPVGPSGLFATMQGLTGWQREVLRAYQTWAVNGDMNIALVGDGGHPLGTPGAVQGDGRFGDVRVAAAAAETDVLGAASPFAWNGSTYNGDLYFNTGQRYSAGPAADRHDLFSVALHEAGHSFGLGHSDVAGSVMGEGYAFRTQLGGSDVAAFQVLYGTRSPDAADAAGGNATRATATPLGVEGLNLLRLRGAGDLGSLGDVDYYKFTHLLLGASAYTVRVKAEGVSLVLPSVTVYDSAGKQVAHSVSTDPLNNDVVVTVKNPRFLSTYYVKVDNATADVFGVGGYRVTVDPTLLGYTPPEDGGVLGPVLDLNLNDVLAKATVLAPLLGGTSDTRFDYFYRGAIENRWDTDSYLLSTGHLSGSGPLNLNVLVWGLDDGGLSPRVRVFDANLQPVAYRVLTNDAGLVSLVVPDAGENSTYYVQVTSRTPGGTGGYALAADVNRHDVELAAGMAAGTLSTSSSVAAGSLSVNSAGVYQFALHAAAVSGGGSVRLTLTDGWGNAVFTLTSHAGQPMTTETRYLAAGEYTLSYEYAPLAGTDGGVTFDLFLDQLSENLGPTQTRVSSAAPSPPPPPPPPPYTYSGTRPTTPPGRPYTL